MKEKFKVQFLQEAAEFIDKLDKSASRKVFYNIRKAQVINDKELFKKLKMKFGNFEHFTARHTIVYLLFGIRQVKKIQL